MRTNFRHGKQWIILMVAMVCAWLAFLATKNQHFSPPLAIPKTSQVLSTPVVVLPVSTVKPVSTPPVQPEPDAAARPRELLVKFRSPAELQAFTTRARSLGARVLGVIPRFGVVRIAFDTDAMEKAILELLPKTASAGLNFLVSTPIEPDPQNDFGGSYLGFGTQALAWLGVPTDNADWGKGIKVAILDTGIQDVAGLSSQSIQQIDLIGSGLDNGEKQYHGTAVASIIGGTLEDTRGLAPGANLLSIRVLDDSGTGDSFTVAQGVLDAVDSGARVISMSIGSAGDSDVLREAINYALSRNVAVVAAVGNEGLGQVSYPAQYPGVIAVTAVDANGRRGAFANYGPQVTLAAPGIGVMTTVSDPTSGGFSGTSAAVPFVSGTLAKMFSDNPNLTAQQATQLLVNYTNDAGAPGSDSFYGSGIMDVSRLLSRNQPHDDAAVADFYFDPRAVTTGQNGVPVQVTVQNRGTTTLSSVNLSVDNAGQIQQFYLAGLPAGSVKSQTILIDRTALNSESGVLLKSRVQVNGAKDANSFNDSRSVRLRLAE